MSDVNDALPKGYRVVLLDDGSRVKIYLDGQEIVSAKIEYLAVFYCWLSAERNSLLAYKESKEKSNV